MVYPCECRIGVWLFTLTKKQLCSAFTDHQNSQEPPPISEFEKHTYLMRVAEPAHQLTGNGALQSSRASLNSLEAPLSPSPPRPPKRLSRCREALRGRCQAPLPFTAGESFLPPNQPILHGFSAGQVPRLTWGSPLTSCELASYFIQSWNLRLNFWICCGVFTLSPHDVGGR